MCIALITTAHPAYPLILLDNRDEYINRPTAVADWWISPSSHVLGGRDLQRPIQGTWLGITRQGRIAVLTNFREEGQDFSGLKSRGGIVNAFLTTPPDSAETTEDFARRLIEEVGVKDVGGFSLVFGHLGSTADRQGLAIVSNRTPDANGVIWIADAPAQTHGLSNSHYGDRSWPKVVQGEQKLKQIIDSHVQRGTSKQDLLKDLFQLLSIDTLPKRGDGEDWQTYIWQLRNSILIPRIGGEQVEASSADEIRAADSEHKATGTNGMYATQKQTVILFDTHNHVTFVERSLYDERGRRQEEEEGTRTFEFDIEK